MMPNGKIEGEPIRSSQDWMKKQMEQASRRIGPDQRVVPVYWIPDENLVNPFEGTEYHAGEPVLVGYNIDYIDRPGYTPGF